MYAWCLKMNFFSLNDIRTLKLFFKRHKKYIIHSKKKKNSDIRIINSVGALNLDLYSQESIKMIEKNVL